MTSRKLAFLIIAAAAFAVGVVSALQAQTSGGQFDRKIRVDIYKGMGGDKEALERGLKACEEALKADPKNAEALVWHGAALYYRGGMAFQSGDVNTGMDLVSKGLEEMERAVAAAPQAPHVLSTRGSMLLISTLYMDENPMKQELLERGLGDFERAYELHKADLPTMSTHAKGELLFGIADGNRRAGRDAKAKEWFERIRKEMADTDYAKRADIFLKTGTLTPQQAQCSSCHTGN